MSEQDYNDPFDQVGEIPVFDAGEVARRRTTTTSATVIFKITVAHVDTPLDRHDWFFPNGWRGVGPIEKRDRIGRPAGKRKGHFPDWFVLMCNNPDCPGRAAVPVSVLTDHAAALDPSPSPVPSPTADRADEGARR